MTSRILKCTKRLSQQPENKKAVQCGKSHPVALERLVPAAGGGADAVQCGKPRAGALQEVIRAAEGANAIQCCEPRAGTFKNSIPSDASANAIHCGKSRPGALGGRIPAAESAEAVRGECRSGARQEVTPAAMGAAAVKRGKCHPVH